MVDQSIDVQERSSFVENSSSRINRSTNVDIKKTVARRRRRSRSFFLFARITTNISRMFDILFFIDEDQGKRKRYFHV